MVVRSIVSPSSAAAGLALLAMALLPLRAGVAARQRTPVRGAAAVEWKTYGADLASTRYSPLDQINKDNFSKLKIAWRLTTNDFGPRPDSLYSATPLFVGNVLYTTAGTARTVVALNPTTGAVLWKHVEDEGPRGQNAARSGAGRGVAYWSARNGSDQRIIYVTPGYRMIALDAKTGEPVSTFGHDGVVDLKLDNDQDLDLVTSDIGLNATPLIAGDVIVVGAAHRFSGSPKTMNNTRGYVRGFDVKTGKRLWIFHTVPQPGEYGYDTWLEKGADRNGNTGAWAQFSADLDLGLVYVPVEMPTGDYYGGNRPGNTLFDESLVALDIKTGKRKWHYQFTHHGIWDYDPPCAPVLYDVVVNGRRVRALAQPTKQAFLFVLDRETGKPIWPIEERAVPQSTVPNERTSPTQPFPTKPLPFDRQGMSVDDLIDFTPALRAQALEVIKKYTIGPLYTPPSLSNVDGPLATIQLPADTGGANWPGASFDPETKRLYVHSHTSAYLAGIVPANPATSDFGYVAGQARAGAAGARGAAAPAADPDAPAPAARPRGAAPGTRGAAGPAAGGRGGTSVQGLPLIKPPYDRITAYDMKTGDIIWQKTHSSTPDDIKNHPALQGVNLAPRLGQPGRTFIGTLTTKTLVVAGEGGVHRKQYIVVAVSGVDGAQLIAYALP
jgi:quinoprotein glucose dehydrogenase